MKTIELMINGQKARFTTKSVTLDGKEYFYSNITKLDHSPVVHSYMFEYNGESKMLTYEKKDTKIMAAIFSQVTKMIDLKKAKAAEQTEKAVKEPEKTSPAPVVEAPPASVETATEEKKAEAPAVKEDLKETVEEDAKAEETTEDAPAEEKAEKEPMDPVKQAKLKKSLKIFGIVLAAIVVASLVYYFLFGTSNAPSGTSPAITESQQYEDIDQLIEDLQ